MLISFLIHLYISITCFLTGILFYSLFQRSLAIKKPLVFSLVTGLIVITLISQLLALFIPVNFTNTLPIVLAVTAAAILRLHTLKPIFENIYKKYKQTTVSVFLIFAFFWFMILVINAGPVSMDDTESYHMQMILWIQKYGTVPGIANLHERFGFNSSWFSSIAFFLPFQAKANMFTMLNGTISVWIGGFLISKMGAYQEKEVQNQSINIPILLLFLLLCICWPMIRGNASTANYDFITTCLIIILLIASFSKKEKKPLNLELEFIVWPAYLISVRIINFPFLLLVFFSIFILLKNRNWQLLFISIFASLAITIPFFIRNILLSGYVFYPSRQFDVMDVNWKVDPTMTDRLLDFIKYFNRINVAKLNIEITKQLGFPEWIPKWFHYLYSYDKPIVLMALAGFILFLIPIKKLSNAFPIHFRVLTFASIAQTISWFLIAPDPRFAYGSLLCGCLVLFIKLNEFKFATFSSLSWKRLLAVIGICFIAYGSLKILRDKQQRNFLFQIDSPIPPTDTIFLHSVPLLIPHKINNNWNPRCFGVTPPCLYKVNPKLRLRGDTIKDGFRLEK